MNGNIITSSSNCNIFENITINNYNGVMMEINNNSIYNLKDINTIIKENLINWENKKYRSANITIHAECSDLIKHFVSEGFKLHHTLGQSIVICKWLDKSCENKIPDYAHHYVGVGAIIINKKCEILLIKEKRRNESKSKTWKFVTGLVNEGESFKDATLREVKEEIGLTIVEFLGNFTVRESYPTIDGKTDICFFNLCTVDEDNDNSKIVFEDGELEEKYYFTIDKLKGMEKEMTDMTWYNLCKFIEKLEDYYKCSKDSKTDEDLFTVLTKISRPLYNVDKSGHFKKAVGF